MKKAEVVLVGPNESSLASSIQNLNFTNVDPVALITKQVGDNNFLRVGEQSIPHVSFSAVQEILSRHGDCFWMICGRGDDVSQAEKHLKESGVAEDKILNFELIDQINFAWLANLRYVEENGADFFATGNSQMELGLDLNYIPHAQGRGVNLSSFGQSLKQGYLTAKHIFERVAPGTIKFVLIGLTPYSFSCEAVENFSSVPRDIQYEFAFNDIINTPPPLHYSDLPIDAIRNFIRASTADLNFDRAKGEFQRHFPEETLSALEGDKNSLKVKDLDENSRILEEYIKLCVKNATKPICVVFPVEATFRKGYKAEVMNQFNQTINDLKKTYKFPFINLFTVNLPATCFYGKAHLNSTGAAATSALLSERLYLERVFSVENIYAMENGFFKILSKYLPNDYKKLIHHTFCKMTYDDFNRLIKTLPKETCLELMANIFSNMTYNHLANLSDMLTKDDYNDLVERIFKISADKIRHKDKITVGFFFENPSKWCGDELYNFFKHDKHFEPIVFFYMFGDELTRKEFILNLDKFKTHGLNIFEIKKANSRVPTPDVLFNMLPYDNGPQAFRLVNLKVTTLMANINYSFWVSTLRYSANSNFHYVLWKIFFSSIPEMNWRQKYCKVGMPRGFFSGYPRMDIFFNPNVKFHFDWKISHPNAKKIIWAPHHSVRQGNSTFKWNHNFMYEFAKAHPEISWVVKPHPFLLSRAVSVGIFSSIEACKEYFQKWDDLPNAKVYVGAYYQAIFATSDGMIQDSASFIAEYQYVDKPMIYLRFNLGEFGELGRKILEASYLVDGRDLDAIAAMMQRVFIEGDDYKAAERRKVFDEYLNYPKYLGMSASEFIYKNIADELKGESE